MATGIGTFYSLLLVQMFYGIAITLLLVYLPVEGAQVSMYSSSSAVMNFGTTSSMVQTAFTNQTQIPLLDFGSLVFYSSSILLNLIVNIVFAIPELLGLFAGIILYFVPLDYTLAFTIKSAFIAICSIAYYVILVSLAAGTRVPTYGGVR